jgi:DNA polymerase-3 subunit delta
MGAGDMVEANTSMVEGGRISPQELDMQVSAAPFLSSSRLVIVHGLLDRFEKQSASGKNRTKTAPGPGAQEFADVINRSPGSTLLVLTGKGNRSNPLLQSLSPHAQVRRFPLLKGRSLAEWVKKRVKDNGMGIDAEGIELLIRRVGSDLWSMSNEVEKLVLGASGNRITLQDVTRLVSATADTSIFSMVDAVVEARGSRAIQECEVLLRQGMSAPQILSMLVRQFRLVLVARAMLDMGHTRAEIQNSLGIGHDFIMQKTMAQASGYSAGQLKEAFRRLLDTDLSIKTSRLQPEIALNLLIQDLAGNKIR